jgi:hypothetical protein
MYVIYDNHNISLHSDGMSLKRINFRDVNELRQLGFDPGSLRAAGFSTNLCFLVR